MPKFKSLLILVLVVALSSHAFAQESSTTSTWQGMSLSALRTLAYKFARDKSAAADCQQLAAYLPQRYAADAAAGTPTNWGAWCDMICVLDKYYSADAKNMFVADLSKAAIANPSQMPETLLIKYCRALDCLGRSDSSTGLAVAWVNTASGFATVGDKTVPLLFTYAFKGTSGDAKAAQAKLVERVGTIYFADAASTKRISIGSWLIMAKAASPSLSQDIRQLWQSKLHPAYAADALLPTMSTSDLHWVLEVLKAVQDPGATQVVLAWIKASNAWQSMTPRAFLMNIAPLLTTQDEAVKVAKASLAEGFRAVLANPTAARTSGVTEWSRLGQFLCKDLPSEAKQAWASTFMNTFAGNAQAIQAMQPIQVLSVGRLLEQLDDQPAIARCVTDYLQGETWKSASPSLVAWFAKTLPDTQGAQPARQKLANYVTSNYLADSSKVSSIPLNVWMPICIKVTGELSDETKQVWASNLKNAFVSTLDSAAKLTSSQFNWICLCLDALGDHSTSDMIINWFSRHQADPTDSMLAMSSIASVLAKADQAKLSTFVSQLEQSLQAKAGGVKWWDCVCMSIIYNQTGQVAKAQEWAMKGYALLLPNTDSTADDASLRRLASQMIQCGMTGPEKQYPAFATAATRLGVQGKLTEVSYEFDAMMFGTNEDIAILKAQLVDPQGNVRFQIARLLSMALQNVRGGLSAWKQTLDKQLADSKFSGDAKSQWLIVRAYAESPSDTKWLPLAGKDWLDQALAAASSTQIKLLAFKEIVTGYLRTVDLEQARSAASEIISTVSEPDFQDKATMLLDQLIRVADEEIDRADEMANVVSKKNDQMHVLELKKRLQEAKSSGDTEAIKRYEQLLNDNYPERP